MIALHTAQAVAFVHIKHAVMRLLLLFPALQDGSAEQLRAMGQLSALVAGFVMVAFIQFGFDPTSVPTPVLLGFGISNALTVQSLPLASGAF